MRAAAAMPAGSKRLWWLLAALGIAFVLVVTDDPPSADVVAPAVRPAAGPAARAVPAASPAVIVAAPANVPVTAALPSPAPAGGESAMILALRPRAAAPAGAGEPANAFPPQDWAPPPPKPNPAALALAARPVAPVFGYKVLGKQLQDDRWEVFLEVQGRTVVAREGDRVDGLFTIERITPPTMTIHAAPFEERQSVPIGEGER